MAHGGSRAVILAALAGNLAIAVHQIRRRALDRLRPPCCREAIHSAVDTGNQGLLLLGLRRAARPPTARHPFGHGMELYFWAFVVALLIFALGGAFSIYQGWQKIAAPHPVEGAWINFAVLGAAVLFEGLSFRVACGSSAAPMLGEPFWAAIRRSKDPSVFAVLLEDFAALAGLLIALVGPRPRRMARPAGPGWRRLDRHRPAAGADRGLPGERDAQPADRRGRRAAAGRGGAGDAAGRSARRTVEELLSMHLGPAEVLMAVTLDFHDDLPGGAVEQAAAS